MRRFLLRLVNAVQPDRAEREFARETAAHLPPLEADYRRRGMTADEAHQAARRAFGGVVLRIHNPQIKSPIPKSKTLGILRIPR